VTACPACRATVDPGDQFCESCGATLVADPTLIAGPMEGSAPIPAPEANPAPEAQQCACGGTFDADGWCTVCGSRAPNERDHFTDQVAPNAAAVCDKGKVHPRNEDAMALAASHERIVLVVCDGVSNSTDSDVASLAAARAARDVLDHEPVVPTRTPDALAAAWTAAFGRAVAAAQERAAAAAVTVGAKENPPSCTFVAAVVDGPVLVAGWVGDSRCYWFGDDGTAAQISVDDSWATAEVARGITREVAERDPRAHSITRWLGSDSPGGAPSCAPVSVEAGGWVLVCSDGLWNYCSEAAELGHLLTTEIAAHGDDPLAVASALCDWANEQGGHDNVTVALAHVAPRPV